MLRGFFIFLIFIWKPSVWKMISKRFPSTKILINSAKKYFHCKPSQLISNEVSGEMTLRTRIEERSSIVRHKQDNIESANL
jgi:hypothetical protein